MTELVAAPFVLGITLAALMDSNLGLDLVSVDPENATAELKLPTGRVLKIQITEQNPT